MAPLGILAEFDVTVHAEPLEMAKVSDGYQTFGAVQSVGPAVILPAVLAFKVLGVSLVTGRVVAGIFAFLTLVMFFLVGRAIIGQRAALIGIIILLSAPGVRFLWTARQFLGIVPALGFFLAGFLLWYMAIKVRRTGLGILAGLLIGCAILAKSQYLVLGLGAFGLIAILDFLYYHLRALKITGIVIGVALACYGGWNLWQWFYYGSSIFAENAEKLYQLGKVAYGLRPNMVISGIRVILGDDTEHYFLFWGFLSLFYAAFASLKKDLQGMALGLLLIFTCLNMGFVIFWTMPWPWHFFAPLAITILLICKLGDDLFAAIARSGSQLKSRMLDFAKKQTPLPMESMAVIGALVALASFTLWLGPNLKNIVTYDVRDRVGEWRNQWPRSFSLPYQTVDFLNHAVAPGSVIETSERELAILTDFNYHSPDQSILINVIPYAYLRTGAGGYQLGMEYFNTINPAYLVIGYFARANDVYDRDFIFNNFEQVQVIGSGEFEYEIYRKK